MDAEPATYQCSDGPYACNGGWFIGAHEKAGGYTVHAAEDITPCWKSSNPGYDFCNFDLHGAIFN
jgi:hypothetical protein